MKEVSKKLKEEHPHDLPPDDKALEEQRPMPTDTPNEFAYLDFKKWAYKKRGKIKKQMASISPGNIERALVAVWELWDKKNKGAYSNIKNYKKFGKVLYKMMKDDRLVEGTCGYAPDGEVDVNNTDKLKPASLQRENNISLKYILEGWITTDPDRAYVYDYVDRMFNWCDLTSEDALDVAGMYEYDYEDMKSAKAWRKFSEDLKKLMGKLAKLRGRYRGRKTVAILPRKLHKELESARFHQEPTREDNYKKVLKVAQGFVKNLEALK